MNLEKLFKQKGMLQKKFKIIYNSMILCLHTTAVGCTDAVGWMKTSPIIRG